MLLGTTTNTFSIRRFGGVSRSVFVYQIWCFPPKFSLLLFDTFFLTVCSLGFSLGPQASCPAFSFNLCRTNSLKRRKTACRLSVALWNLPASVRMILLPALLPIYPDCFEKSRNALPVWSTIFGQKNGRHTFTFGVSLWFSQL